MKRAEQTWSRGGERRFPLRDPCESCDCECRSDDPPPTSGCYNRCCCGCDPTTADEPEATASPVRLEQHQEASTR
jgi:hypothetical protein